MQHDLKGEAAVVTGAASGIGEARGRALMHLQGLEKRDQRLFVFRRQLQSEWVTQDRTVSAMVTFRHVTVVETLGIEPFL
jgi:NADP-dependent 3-hydroxy acid dehydrogenase YdfG